MKKNVLRVSMVCGVLFLLVGTVVISSSVATTPQPTRVVSISGTIYGLPLDGTGVVPIEGVRVLLIGGKLIGGITFALEKSDATSQDGQYSFSDIPIGVFFIIARKPGEYIGSFRLVRLTPDEPTKQNQDITLIRLG